MDLSSPDTWRWIWLSAAVIFAVGEIAVAGSFFLKYLETLAVMANGQATKIFLPTESTAMFGALGGIKELFNGLGGAAS